MCNFYAPILAKKEFGQMKKSLTVEKVTTDKLMYERVYELNIEEKYHRTPINYNDLDHIGHGPNTPKQKLNRSVSIT